MTLNRKFLLFLTGTHGLFFLLALVLKGHLIPDSYDYLFQAENFRDHNSWYAWNWNETIKPDYYTKRTPGYGFLVYILGSQQWLILLVQNALSIATCWLIFKTMSSLTGDKVRSALFISLILLVQSNQLIYSNTIISEIPFQFVLFLGVFLLFRYLKEKKYAQLASAVLLFAIALLIKPVMLFFAFPLGFLVTVFYYRNRDWKILPLVLVLPLVIIGWSRRNEKLMGYNHYTSITTVNLKDYNTRLTLEAKYGQEKADSIITGINKLAGQITDYKTQMAFLQDTCKKLLSENIKTYAGIHAKGMAAMLLDPGRFDYVNFFGIEKGEGENGLMYRMARGDLKGMMAIIKQQSPLISFFFFLNLAGSTLLVLLALTSLRFIRKETFFILILAGIIGYFWILTGPVGTARYKSAIFPILVLLAGWSFGKWRGKGNEQGLEEKVVPGVD